jgi:hypothetical protein
MKGIVFTEFFDMVDDKMSPEMAEQIIDDVNVESGCAYTAIGTYDYSEMVDLVGALSQRSGVSIPDLQKTYGHHLFGVFVDKYPMMFREGDTAFDVLERVDDTIHREVHKLYPDAELPKFVPTRDNDVSLKLDYTSSRPFADLAEGLIKGCIDHFGEDIIIHREDISPPPQTHTLFTLERVRD